ncbi:hypothetical protein N7474_007818 [Penicillium riverlandense]|uniref:uncharacterized protein n=1 Tax=Penicillium riverlandense TaxID=1903569 RepID=UPI002547E304|nr:uncharacterized protein N7474_007818 [Penicillium riverlandense]KAJ5811517.1 hypothetical protein N7474_007818 [Penicillium riverlandense]
MPRLSSLRPFLEACRPPCNTPPARVPPPRAVLLRQRATPTLTTLRPCIPCRSLMNGRKRDPHSLERVTKRRRISPSPARDSSSDAMNHTISTIELTPLESTLRTLLLDVAQYIRDQEIVEGGSDVRNHPDTVLRFTGGWVRDKLLGVDSHDIDVGISSMTGYQFGMALKQYLDDPQNLEKYKQSLPEGKMHDAIVSLHKIEANPEKSKHLETVTTKIFGLDIDLVNLRKETYSEESRNPQMEFGTATEDALRRDATINALFYNLNESRLEDLTGHGLEDMQNRLIRTPMEPYQTFRDDPLRVLRLVRFASRLGYQIDPETERAMQNEDIRVALRLKISKERVANELEKMLKGEEAGFRTVVAFSDLLAGPDPRGALQFIDRLDLYHTIFANHQDGVAVDTRTWSLAYNALARFLHPEIEESSEVRAATERVRRILVRDEGTVYYAWVGAAFTPWISIPERQGTGAKAKNVAPRAVEVARESLRMDNKTLTILRDASRNYEGIIATKSCLLDNSISGSPAEIRQQIGLLIRSWGKDWRICVLLALLQEIMEGHDLTVLVHEYDRFLAYIVDQDLEDVCELKPIVNGDEIMKALEAKKGPWMSKALTVVMNVQLLRPGISKEQALDEVRRQRAELGL